MNLEEFLSTLDPSSHAKGKQWEVATKALLEAHPQFRERFQAVYLWSEWPDRPFGDEIGIDLVAYEADGSLCAIQAKNWDQSSFLPKPEIDSFVTASANRHYRSRLLVATTDRIGRNARRVIDDLGIQTLLRTEIERLDLDWSTIQARPQPPVRHEPLPHQEAAVNDVVENLKNRGQLIMACGTGKTLTSLFVYERLSPRRALVLVPSLELLRQTMREWATHGQPGGYEQLAVCSDGDVSKDADRVVASISDLMLPPSSVTSDPAQIRSFIRRRKPLVVFGTYQSSPRIAEAQDLGAPAFGLAVADEAHRTASRKSGAFAAILRDIKAEKILFQTATPRVIRAKKTADGDDPEIYSMDDVETYGDVLHTLSFRRAIKEHLLADYRLHVATVDGADAEKAIEQRELLRVDGMKGTDARTLAVVMALHRFLRDYEVRRTVTFHSRVKSARAFARQLEAWDKLMEAEGRGLHIKAEAVAGADPSADRNRKLGLLGKAAQVTVLTNARCLTEGIDVPDLDLVAFVEPKRSEIDLAQAVGRVLRSGAKKDKLGHVFVPLFATPDRDLDQALTDSSYKALRDVLWALRQFDEALVEELNMLQRRGLRDSSMHLPDKVVIEDYRDISEHEQAAFERQLDIQLVRLGDPRRRWFELADELEAIGLKNVQRGSKHYFKINNVRQAKKRGALSEGLIARFEVIPGWDWGRPTEAEVLRAVRSVLEENPGPTVLDLAERVGVGRQRLARLISIWEQEEIVRIEFYGRARHVYLAEDDAPSPLGKKQGEVLAEVSLHPGRSWNEVSRSLELPTSSGKPRFLKPLVARGEILTVPAPGGERLFPADRFSRPDAIAFLNLDLLDYLRSHPGSSGSDLVKPFGPGVAQTLRRLEGEGLVRRTWVRSSQGPMMSLWFAVCGPQESRSSG